MLDCLKRKCQIEHRDLKRVGKETMTCSKAIKNTLLPGINKIIDYKLINHLKNSYVFQGLKKVQIYTFLTYAKSKFFKTFQKEIITK